MGYPGYSPNPQQPGRWTATPSLWWIFPGIVAVLVGGIGVIISAFGAWSQVTAEVGDFQRVESPGSGWLTLASDSDYVIYLEGVGDEFSPEKDIAVTLTDQAGRPVEVRAVGPILMRHVDGLDGRAGYAFHADHHDTYLLTGVSQAGVTLTVAEGKPAEELSTVAKEIVLWNVVVVIGTTMVFTIFRCRARSRTALDLTPR
ncbi:hypothetical protein [Nocardia sp. NPDC057668]|uniref:hypothetical protein n=1 Tax=Nocardia sp. NPDC057668 TaxID=3346202 RepID=UPI00366C3FED